MVVVNLTTKPLSKVYVDGKYVQESSYGVTQLIVKEGQILFIKIHISLIK